MIDASLFLNYAVAAAVGTLMGMQRESATAAEGRRRPAGVRTFALVGIWGCLSAQVSQLSGSSVPLAASVGILGAFLTAMFLLESKDGRSGLTTEVSMVVAFLTGVLAFNGRLAMAGALGVVSTLLLSLKLELHAFARNLTREDMFATLKFAILVTVFLPILPDRSYFAPPFDVINPFQIGVFIVLMSAVGFVGYILAKTLGAARGIGLMGLLGGMVSSTAVTLGFTQRSRTDPGQSGPLASAIVAAWTVMSLRTLIVVSTLDLQVGLGIWVPLIAFAAAGACFCLYLYLRNRTPGESGSTPFSNPFELGPAIRFGFLFVIILVASRAAQFFFGDAGIYLSSFAAGLMDVDAVSFSMTRLSTGAGLDAHSAGQAILLALLSNSLLKGGFAVVAGSRELRKALLPGTLLMLAAGCAGAWLAWN